MRFRAVRDVRPLYNILPAARPPEESKAAIVNSHFDRFESMATKMSPRPRRLRHVIHCLQRGL
jgi:hypothetical protein